MQAVTRVNVEQASKRAMWKPTRLRNGEGRSPWINRATEAHGFHRGSDDGMHERGIGKQNGKPLRCGREPQRELREEQARPYEVTERPVVVKTPGNTGRAKGP